MSITTKTGDKGTTSLFGGKRVDKDDPQIQVIGAIDEATSFIGFASESIKDKQIKKILVNTQMSLYIIMGFLSGAKFDKRQILNQVKDIEKEISERENNLPKLLRFVIPQGSEQSTRLHMARTIVRRSEREFVQFIKGNKANIGENLLILQFLNRLSDLLFILAREFDRNETIA